MTESQAGLSRIEARLLSESQPHLEAQSEREALQASLLRSEEEREFLQASLLRAEGELVALREETAHLRSSLEGASLEMAVARNSELAVKEALRVETAAAEELRAEVSALQRRLVSTSGLTAVAGLLETMSSPALASAPLSFSEPVAAAPPPPPAAAPVMVVAPPCDTTLPPVPDALQLALSAARARALNAEQNLLRARQSAAATSVSS